MLWRSNRWARITLVLSLLGGSELVMCASPVHSQDRQTISGSKQATKNSAGNISQTENSDDRITTYTLWLAIFTGALVIVSCIQFIFVIRADKTSRISANAATKAAGATADTVKKMGETAEKQLRAYVNISGAKVLDPVNPDTRRAAVEVKNFGQTPARDQTMWAGTVVREFPLKSQLSVPCDSLPVGKESLPPGRSSVIEVPIGPLSDWEELQLRSGNAAVYVIGEIRYADIFGHSRMTTFRLFCWREMLAEGRLGACPEGNDAT